MKNKNLSEISKKSSGRGSLSSYGKVFFDSVRKRFIDLNEQELKIKLITSKV